MSEHPLAPHPAAGATGEFLAFVSHDWLQPLNTLALAAQCFQDDYEDGYLNDEKVKSFGSECTGLVGRVASALFEWRQLFEPSPTAGNTDLQQIVSRLVKICSPRFRNIGVVLSLEPLPEETRLQTPHPAFIPLMFVLLGHLHRQLRPLASRGAIALSLDTENERQTLGLKLTVSPCLSGPGESAYPWHTAAAFFPDGRLPAAFAEAGWSCTLLPAADGAEIRLTQALDKANQ